MTDRDTIINNAQHSEYHACVDQRYTAADALARMEAAATTVLKLVLTGQIDDSAFATAIGTLYGAQNYYTEQDPTADPILTINLLGVA